MKCKGDIRKAAFGRPPKFREPRRPITVTLPERILAQLTGIDPDRAKAIVKAVDAVHGNGQGISRRIELVEMAHGKSLIVVGPNRILRRIPWLKLIEIAPSRFIVTVPPGTAVETLEVALSDILNDPDFKEDRQEKDFLHELTAIIGQQRRTKRMSKAEILIVESK